MKISKLLLFCLATLGLVSFNKLAALSSGCTSIDQITFYCSGPSNFTVSNPGQLVLCRDDSGADIAKCGLSTTKENNNSKEALKKWANGQSDTICMKCAEQ